MEHQTPSKIENEESFESDYRLFIFCLDALASSPLSACDKYGNYNVAYELQLDVSSGTYLSNHPSHRLSQEQILKIQELSTILLSLPDDAVVFSNTIEESIQNMEHPSWEPIRALAVKLLENLIPVTELNTAYFETS